MKLIKIIVLFLAVVFLSFAYKERIQKRSYEISDPKTLDWKSPSVKMYFALKKYSEKYGIPEKIAFSLAWHETRYQGPNHKEYEWRLVSSAGALGPMQIMPVAGRRFAPRKYSDSLLLNDIDFNVETSMRIIKFLKKRFGTWELAAGCYNTGQPIINGYAKSVASRYFSWR